jgi:hypothetical protein
MAVCDSNVCTYPLIPGCVFLVSIVVTPVNLNLPVGAVQQYTATGIFSDATMADITTIVSWSSSNEIVAHISNAPGFQAQATMLSPGLTTITATLGVQGSTSLSVGCYDAPSNLVGWWPGNLNANDVIAGNNGTWSGAYIPGEVQEAFDLPGTQTPFVSIPNSAAYETQVLTLDAWINAGPQGNFKYIIAKGFNNDCASASSYAFYTGNTGGLFFYVSDGASAYLSPGASPSIWDNNWHFVAGVYDGLRVSLYVDGVLVPGSIPQSPVIQYNFDDNSLIFGTYPGCNLNYNGGLDEVEIFNRALTSTEIQNIYLAGSFGKCNP